MGAVKHKRISCQVLVLSRDGRVFSITSPPCLPLQYSIHVPQAQALTTSVPLPPLIPFFSLPLSSLTPFPQSFPLHPLPSVLPPAPPSPPSLPEPHSSHTTLPLPPPPSPSLPPPPSPCPFLPPLHSASSAVPCISSVSPHHLKGQWV